MKTLKTALAALILITPSCASMATQPGPQPDITLVQSIPEGTGLEQPDLPFAKDIWPQLFDEARSSIDMAEFYLTHGPGDTLERAIQALERAAARGVRVRILVQSTMMQQDLPTYDRLKAVHGVELLPIEYKKLGGGILHAKYLVVDRSVLYIGSQNFDWRSLTQIHELGVRLRDPELAGELEEIFEIDWKFAQTGSKPAPQPATGKSANSAGIQLVGSPPEWLPADVAPALPALLALLGQARREIRIQLLDFDSTRWDPIDSALRVAVSRGVRVRLLVSHWNQGKPAVNSLKSLARAGVEIRFAAIPELASGCIPFSRVVHSKYLVVDDQTLWLGTSNWSRGYFVSSRNVELIFRKPELAQAGTRIFEKLWNSPYAQPIDPAREYPKPVKDCDGTTAAS